MPILRWYTRGKLRVDTGSGLPHIIVVARSSYVGINFGKFTA